MALIIWRNSKVNCKNWFNLLCCRKTLGDDKYIEKRLAQLKNENFDPDELERRTAII